MIYPLVTPSGASVDVVGKERRDTLLARGYREDPVPPSPTPQRFQGAEITADVVLVPWKQERVENAARYKEEIPHLQTVADETRAGCWPTVKRAWQHGLGRGTHHLVLSDDLVLAKGFWEALTEIVSLFPDSPLCLFTVKKAAAATLAEGNHWCISWGCIGAANVLPTRMIQPFLEWQEQLPQNRFGDDVRLTAWAVEQGLGILVPVPCLVEHGHLPGSVDGSPMFGRVHSQGSAWTGDVRGVDWTRGAHEPRFIGVSVARPPWLDRDPLAQLRRQHGDQEDAQTQGSQRHGRRGRGRRSQERAGQQPRLHGGQGVLQEEDVE